eukprot:14734324-Alexandrium_andersonii.AAC.1
MTFMWRRCAGAFTAPGLPLPGGRRCAPPAWRASDSFGEKLARAAFTMPSSTSGALCTGANVVENFMKE